MERIYCDVFCNAENEETNNLFLKLAAIEAEEASKCSDENDLKAFVIGFHGYVRVKLNLPNKIFAFVTNKDKTKADILLFPKEPDGNWYKAFYDEEVGNVYILVEERE